MAEDTKCDQNSNLKSLAESMRLLHPAKESTCTGRVFKGYASFFYHNGRIERKEGVRVAKRLSCRCDECGWVDDAIQEAIATDTLIMPEIEHGRLYGIELVNESRDWESGIVDGYDVEICLLPEGEQP